MSNKFIDFLNDPSKTRKEKIIAILSDDNNSPKSVKEIKESGKHYGLKEIEKWNVSMVLKSLKGDATKLIEGYTLTSQGKTKAKQFKLVSVSPTTNTKSQLRSEADKINSKYVKDFVVEAIGSLEYGLLKSAVVFSWIGAISLLYEFIVKNKLAEFNKEAKRRFPKWKNASNIDGLTRMKEYDFLQIIEGISLMGKNTKNELESCLKLRNSCGHPSTLKIGESKVAAHIEILLLNVYQKF